MVPNIVPTVIHHSKALFAVAAALAAAGAGVACAHHPATEAGAQRRPSAGAAAGPAGAVKLLTASFEARAIRKIEVGDFHFTAGQLAPIHTHAAPALGYVSKGSIIYQVEGQPVQLLRAGDAFYEPVGPRILHFDNGSQTEEAVFTDFNFERAGEPFIVFPTPPVNLKIDRRTFPTVEIENGPKVGAIDIYARTLEPGASVQRPTTPLPVMGYVADGTIELRAGDGPDGSRSIATGQSFGVPAGRADVTLTNPSPSAQAKIVTFEPTAE